MGRARLAAALVCTMCAGCAETRVYSTPDLSRCEPGVKFFQVSRPVLLVKKTDACGRPTKVEIAYLPDLDRPRYAELRPGLGTIGYEVAMKGGYATRFEVKEGDSQIPELLDAAANAGIAIIAADAALDELGVRRRND